MTPIRYVDRSRMLDYMRCPRLRYLGYEFGGHGIAQPQLSIPLATGAHIHGGLEGLLKGVPVEAAVTAATSAYRTDAERFLTAKATHLDHFDYTIAEQTALVEALVRVYALRGLPALLSAYEIVEVESEYEYALAPGAEGPRMMSRLDGLLRLRSNGDLHVLSFKTDSGNALEGKLADAAIDLQGLTEPLARWKVKGELPFAVKMEWLVKGSWREEVRGSGMRYQDSYLVRPWSRPGPVSGTQFAWKYFWPCPEVPHKIEGKRPWTCKGEEPGRTHGLGDSWTRVPIWQHMSIKEWIGLLAEGQIQPEAGDALASALYLPPPISRKEQDVIAAARVLASQEETITGKLALLERHEVAPGVPMISALDVVFPATGAYTNQCLHMFGETCKFFALCHAADRQQALVEALGEGGYVARTPHHEPELLQIKGVAQ